jgi:hypothetical protein
MRLYGFLDVRDTGLRATWRWIRGLFGLQPRALAAAPSGPALDTGNGPVINI